MFLLLIAAADTFSGQLLASDVPSTEMLRLSLQGAVRHRCRGHQTPAVDHCYPPFDAEKEFTLSPDERLNRMDRAASGPWEIWDELMSSVRSVDVAGVGLCQVFGPVHVLPYEDKFLRIPDGIALEVITDCEASRAPIPVCFSVRVSDSVWRHGSPAGRLATLDAVARIMGQDDAPWQLEALWKNKKSGRKVLVADYRRALVDLTQYCSVSVVEPE